nr:choice-of-anchor J domain-containing protein [Prevotella sp.]
MKKFIYSCLFLAMAAITFSSCEDVPAPYNMPTEDETPEVQPAGTGTAADPFNVAGVEKYIDEGGSAETEVYVKGKVVSVVQGSWDAKYGSLKYYISEDGTATNQFYVYNGYAGPNRTKFSGEDALKQGDEVVICGKVDVYNGTKEFLVNNYIVSLNGVGGTTTPDTPTDGYINETFSKSFGTFTLKNIKGTPWVIDSYGYAKATGYENVSKVTTPSESYLVSKAIDLSTSKGATLKFSYILRYATFNGVPTEGVKNQVLITENYTGDPTTTKWTDITGTLREGTDWKTWSTYTFDLAPYKGKKNIVIALHYACEAKSGTWQIKELTVKEGTPTVEPETPDTPSTGDTTTPNGNFETWVDGKPNNWKTASSAGNASLAQSTDAHSGKYSVKVGGSTSANKRLGYKEMELKAGTYKIKYYVKAATATGASIQSGFVPVTEGKVGDYKYSGYINNISNTEWTLVEQELVIPSDGTYCIVIMNSKKPGGDVLIDDLTLTLGETVIIK